MTSAREWQLIGLNTIHTNLQRLHVWDRASAMIAHTPEDEERTATLRSWMDVVGTAFTSTLQGEELDAHTQEALLPLAPWLRDEVARYYAQHDPQAPLCAQAAFGAAHVLASDYQTNGERVIAEAVGDAREADRLLQYGPRMNALVRQANTAVGTCAQGAPTTEVESWIAEHVKVMVGDERRMTAQVGAIPAMLRGRDPRE